MSKDGSNILLNNLNQLFLKYPLEDGCYHPAEDFIKGFLEVNIDNYRYIESLYYEQLKEGNISFCIGIMFCIAELDWNSVFKWGLPMAEKGISHPNIQVRDVCAKALESWDTGESINVLSNWLNQEKVGWFKDYIQRVINDFKGKN